MCINHLDKDEFLKLLAISCEKYKLKIIVRNRRNHYCIWVDDDRYFNNILWFKVKPNLGSRKTWVDALEKNKQFSIVSISSGEISPNFNLDRILQSVYQELCQN